MKLPEMTPEELREVSLILEKRTGYDSIPTIERLYGDEVGGMPPYECAACGYRVRDAVQMWRHVHGFTVRELHGTSFSEAEIVAALAENARGPVSALEAGKE